MSLFPLPSGVAAIKRVATADPSAGNEFTITVPTAGPKYWYLMGVSVNLVQGITQTPFPSLIIDDGANILFQGFAGTAALNASVTAQVSWAPGLLNTGSGASTVLTGALPLGLVLNPGSRIRSLTTGIGANTDYGIASIFVCELGT